MKTGVGLALIAVGAILAFAVTTNTSVFNLHTAGWVLIIIGIIGIAVPRRGYGWVGRRVFTRQTRRVRGARVEEVAYPTYATRNPADTRVQAGLPAPGALGSSAAADHIGATPGTPGTPGSPVTTTRDLGAEVRPATETEVIEDVYDE